MITDNRNNEIGKNAAMKLVKVFVFYCKKKKKRTIKKAILKETQFSNFGAYCNLEIRKDQKRHTHAPCDIVLCHQ